MSTATLVTTVEHARGDGALYRIDTPGKPASWAMVSFVEFPEFGSGTYVFQCTERGTITSMGEPLASHVGRIPHALAIEAVGVAA